MSNTYFLTLPSSSGITGDATDPAYPGAFTILSHAFSLQQIVSNSGSVKIQTTGLTITKPFGVGTPLLLLAAANGTDLGAVVLSGVKSGSKDFEFETLTLSDATITNFAEEEAGAIPTITMTLSFSKIQYVYTLPNGTKETGILSF